MLLLPLAARLRAVVPVALAAALIVPLSIGASLVPCAVASAQPSEVRMLRTPLAMREPRAERVRLGVVLAPGSRADTAGVRLDEVEPEAPAEAGDPDGYDPDEDPALAEAIRLVVEMDTASTSMLQRRLRLGYTRAGRLIDMLERRGIISGYEGSKPRQVLITAADLPRVLSSLEPDGGEPNEAGSSDATVVAGSPAEEAE